MAITRMDRQTVGMLRQRVQKHLRLLSEELGVSISVDGGRFNRESVTFKTEVAITGADPWIEETEAFKQFAASFGLSPDDFGKSFSWRGKSYTICGLKSRSYKYPILAKNARGKVYKFAVEAIKKTIK